VIPSRAPKAEEEINDGHLAGRNQCERGGIGRYAQSENFAARQEKLPTAIHERSPFKFLGR
jgi:hypothetical protein